MKSLLSRGALANKQRNRESAIDPPIPVKKASQNGRFKQWFYFLTRDKHGVKVYHSPILQLLMIP